MRLQIALALTAVSAPSVFGQVTLGGLDSTRCRPFSGAGTFGYDDVRAGITAPAFQAATGFQIVVGPETGTLTAGYLAGVDVLFLGDGASGLSAAEAGALQAWHAAGGALLLVADSNSAGLAGSALAAIGSPHGYGAAGCGAALAGNPIASLDDPLTNGPFGDLRGASFSTTLAPGLQGVAPADVIGTCFDGAVLFARHAPGAVNGPSSGPVFMTADASFIGLFTAPANASFFSQTNVDLALNVFAYLGGNASTTVGTSYCQAVPNSTGSAGAISASGSASALLDDLTLRANDLPGQQFGIFIVSATQGFVPGTGGASNGNLCLGGNIGRFVGPGQILGSGASGAFELRIPLTQIPQGGGAVPVMPGDTWNFQAWYRDGVGLGSNLTDGLSVVFF